MFKFNFFQHKRTHAIIKDDFAPETRPVITDEKGEQIPARQVRPYVYRPVRFLRRRRNEMIC
ncbi:hypothetical protein [Chitinophaga sp. sic0106]|uniref:hypothetical protein n=1 Tax=Chitinophaga sp. sic0106 TaxID=2854785 RepID=UPI001C480921|nr:hypothetical protein [Chitinophaga sp. sic0106]MBV7530070.1 hypothetical protein [Chitinophaga sp. sic0106]